MDEFFLILAVTVILPLVILKMTLDYRRDRMRLENERPPSASEFTVGQLKELINEVVVEANEPLVQRIEQLERQSVADLGPTSEGEMVSVAERTMGRRVS